MTEEMGDGSMSEPTKENQKMPFGWALFCILFLLISMILSVVWLDIPVHINLLASMAVTLAVAAINGKSWDEIAGYIEYGGKICMAPTLTMMIIGILIGPGGSLLVGRLMFQMTIYPAAWITLCAFTLSVALGILFGIYPAAKAARLQPVEALRAE